MRTLGIDEAGRGAIIGPLVIAGFCCHDSLTEYLWGIGVKDSKKLSPKQRNEIYKRLNEFNKPKKDVSGFYCLCKVIKIFINDFFYLTC